MVDECFLSSCYENGPIEITMMASRPWGMIYAYIAIHSMKVVLLMN